MSIIVLSIVAVVSLIVWASRGSPLSSGIAASFVFLAAGALSSLILGLFLLSLITHAVVASSPRYSSIRLRCYLVTVGVFATVVTLMLAVRVYQTNRLSKAYAFESLRNRVATKNEPIEVDFGVYYEPRRRSFGERTAAIRHLHESAVIHFLAAPEFGVERMGVDALRMLKNDDGSPIQLLPYQDFAARQNFWEGKNNSNRRYEDSELTHSHVQLQSWFAETNRNGLVEDVDHVAGFKAHAIDDRVLDTSAARWLHLPNAVSRTWDDDDDEGPLTLRSLQLVGLLYHDKPIVYDLDSTPTLVNAKTAPVRPLDDFECRALEVLKTGDPIYYEVSGTTTRMMGALMSEKSCVECHRGSTAQLLGAFSYILTLGDYAPDSQQKSLASNAMVTSAQ